MLHSHSAGLWRIFAPVAQWIEQRPPEPCAHVRVVSGALAFFPNMTYAAWRLYFERVTGVPDVEVNLAEAALILASDVYTELDVADYLARLDALSEALMPKLPRDREPLATIAALNAYLYDELGFVGNRQDYYDPRNSYLNEVIERRTGLPITLSVIVLALARRSGLPIVGVGLPGHFVVKWQAARGDIIFDPFDSGRILDRAAIEARVRATAQVKARFQSDWLDAVGAKYILVRMLNNLKGIYLHTEQTELARQVVDKLLILDPRAGDEIRDFGLLSLRLGAYRQAAESLEQYLLSHPDAADGEQVRLYLRLALEHIERLN